MHIQTSVLSGIQDARRHEQPKGYGDDQIDRTIWSLRGLVQLVESTHRVEDHIYSPASECVNFMNRK